MCFVALKRPVLEPTNVSGFCPLLNSTAIMHLIWARPPPFYTRMHRDDSVYRVKLPGSVCTCIIFSSCMFNRILPVTWLHIHVFYPCTLVYTCNSNLVPNTSAVYFISTYTNDFTVILRSFSRMRQQIASGRFSSPKNGLGPRLILSMLAPRVTWKMAF